MTRLLPLSADADTARLWDDFVALEVSRRSGAVPALQAVLRSDPSFALPHAMAVLLATFDETSEFDPGVEMRAALRGRSDHDWERSFVEAVSTTRSQGIWPAWPSWRRHQQRFPADLVALEVAAFCAEFSTDADPAALTRPMADAAARAVGDHPTVLGLQAMVAQDQGRLDDAYRLASRSLELDPTGFDGGHPMAHVFFEAGDHTAGAEWLDGWLPTTDQVAPFGGHLLWHSALHHLAVGNGDAVLERYRRCTTRTGAGALFDGTSLLWRCQLHGLLPPGSDPAPVGPEIDAVPFTFVGAHVALRLATADDAEGLRRFATSAAVFDAPGAAELLPGLALGLAAYVEGDHAVAADLLLAEERRFCRYGGSHAQREVFEDTLLRSLVESGRFDEAVTRLQARLDRRESRFDTALLARAK